MDHKLPNLHPFHVHHSRWVIFHFFRDKINLNPSTLTSFCPLLASYFGCGILHMMGTYNACSSRVQNKSLYWSSGMCMTLILDCRKEAWANCYPLTFMAAIIWISAYSYMMVWMITVIGFTLTIPDTVMGLTFIAAGVSVPDALSGIAVIREGKSTTTYWILVCKNFSNRIFK